jgi:hypothetical protein
VNVFSFGDAFVRRSDVMASETPDGAVLVDAVSGGCWELNRVGAALWSLLEQPATVDSLCNSLRARYEVAGEVIEQDVRAIIEELSKAGLVSTPAPSTAASR